MVDELQYKPGLGKSDHICLEFNYNCYTEISVSSQNKLNFFKGNYNAISEDLNNIQWELELNNKHMAESWESFAGKLSNSIEKTYQRAEPTMITARKSTSRQPVLKCYQIKTPKMDEI